MYLTRAFYHYVILATVRMVSNTMKKRECTTKRTTKAFLFTQKVNKVI